jgi:hypothetical protein
VLGIASGTDTRLFACNSFALDLRVFTIQVFRGTVPMSLGLTLWPAFLLPYLVSTLSNPFFTVKRSAPTQIIVWIRLCRLRHF